MQVYVVFVDTGCYDSWERNAVRAYSNFDRAEKFIKRKNDQLNFFKKMKKKDLKRFLKKYPNISYLSSVNGYEFEEMRVW